MTTQTPLPGGGSPSGPPPTSPAGPRMISWLVTSLLVGWAIAYTIFRIGGRSPRGAAAWPSLLVGIGIGAVIFGVTVLIWRRYVASGRIRPHGLEEIPPPERLDQRQRGALEVLWPAVAVMAVVALAVGTILAFDWLQTDGSRSATKIVLAGWNLLVGIWLLLEAVELRRLHGDAVESIALAAPLTAVFGGVALSQDMFGPAQVVLIVVAGVVGVMAYLAGWRLLGSRGVPVGAALEVGVCALALILPTVF